MTTPAPSQPKPRTSVARLVVLGLLLTALAAGVYAYVSYQNRDPGPPDMAAQLKLYLAQQAKADKLTDGYIDANADLLADPDPARYVNPPELVFSAVAGDNPEEAEKLWQPFLDLVAKKTGKKVVYLKDPPAPPTPPAEGDESAAPSAPAGRTLESQLDDLRAGKLHVTALSTGQVPFGVNTAGFHPLFCPADAAGKFAYQMEVIVPAGSTAQTPGDLKGSRDVALVALSSNSGGKAALVLFKEKFGMLPGAAREYDYALTGSHNVSVYGVCVGRTAAPVLANPKATDDQKKAARAAPGPKYPAACVANDLLQQMVERGDVKKEDYRTVHTSADFPPLCFGVPHNLHPDVRKGVEAAFAEFKFEGTPVGERYKAQKRVKFAPVNYKEHWQTVREVDARLARLLD